MPVFFLRSLFHRNSPRVRILLGCSCAISFALFATGCKGKARAQRERAAAAEALYASREATEQTETPSEYDRLEQEMLGASGDNVIDPVADLASAMDSLLESEGGIESSSNQRQDDATESRNPYLAAKEDKTASTGTISSNVNSSVSADRERLKPEDTDTTTSETLDEANTPKISWNDQTGQPDVTQATPADREAMIGTAKDPTVNPATIVPHISANNATTMLSEEADNSPNQPKDRGPRAFDRNELFALLSSKLHREAAYSTAPLREYAVLASLMMFDDTRKIDPDDLYNLNDRERDVLRHFQEFFAAAGKEYQATGDPEILVDHANRFAEAMGNNAELNIPAFRLCSEVTGFGDYAEYKDLTFVRSRPIQMIGYIEVENSDPKITAEGQHKTTLKVELELYTDSDSTIVWNQPAQTVVDICNTKRQDFFVVYRINLPPNLNVGTYYLKARVRDEESGEEAESIQTITVVARK